MNRNKYTILYRFLSIKMCIRYSFIVFFCVLYCKTNLLILLDNIKLSFTFSDFVVNKN